MACHADDRKRCYAPSVKDKNSNMVFYHLGEIPIWLEMGCASDATELSLVS